MSSKRNLLLSVCALAFAGGAAAVYAQESLEEFYTGKTVDLIIGYAPGGGYDRYARLIARFLPKFIPGNPEIVARNMPGGGTRTAASNIYSVAP
jgi:tripartite-type tricarboxylate transporter receptor subunit TctC